MTKLLKLMTEERQKFILESTRLTEILVVVLITRTISFADTSSSIGKKMALPMFEKSMFHRIHLIEGTTGALYDEEEEQFDIDNNVMEQLNYFLRNRKKR